MFATERVSRRGERSTEGEKPTLSAATREGDDTSRKRGGPRGGAEQSAPGAQVRREVLVARGPARSDLEIDLLRSPVERTEALRQHARDGPAGGVRVQARIVQGVGEPAPGDLAEHRVCADLGLEGRPYEGHEPERPVPGLLTRRVVQDDEATGRQVLGLGAVSYTHLRAHETRHDIVCRLLLEK